MALRRPIAASVAMSLVALIALVGGMPAHAQETSPAPTSSPTPEPTNASRRQLEDDLFSRVPSLGCRRWRQGDEPIQFGARAAIHCRSPAPHVGQLALFTFPDATLLADFWAWRVDQIDPEPAERESACRDGRVGIAKWDHGDIVCYIQRRTAKIRWSDERTSTYGVTDADDIHIGGLYRWWADREPSAVDESGVDRDPYAEAIAADFAGDPRIPTAHDERIAYLLAHVADPKHGDADGKATTSGCRPMRSQASTSLEPLSLAGIVCEPTRRGGARYGLSEPVRYFLFPSGDALEEWWTRRMRDEPDRPIEPWSGSFSTCLAPEFVELAMTSSRSHLDGETGWASDDGSQHGRVACWVSAFDPSRQSLRWTVTQEFIGGTAPGAEWFTAVHPERHQMYPAPGAGEEVVASFADPDAMHKLPRDPRAGEPLGTEPPPGPLAFTVQPSSRSGLPVGVIHPVGIEQCFGFAGFPPDVDGSFWQAVGGVDPKGRRIRFGPATRSFHEGAIVEFLKIIDDEARCARPMASSSRTNDTLVRAASRRAVHETAGHDQHPGPRIGPRGAQRESRDRPWHRSDGLGACHRRGTALRGRCTRADHSEGVFALARR